MKKKLHIPPTFLAFGYSAAERPLVCIPNGSYELAEISGSPLNFLDDMRSEHLVFAEFEDEMIDISDGTETYAVFGTDPDNLYVIDEGDTVHALSIENAEKIYCNLTLRDFARCQNLYAAEIYRLRAYLLPDIADGRVFDFMVEAGERLKAVLTRLDEGCVQPDTYWAGKIDLLAEGGAAIFSGLECFFRKGRISV